MGPREEVKLSKKSGFNTRPIKNIPQKDAMQQKSDQQQAGYKPVHKDTKVT